MGIRNNRKRVIIREAREPQPEERKEESIFSKVIILGFITFLGYLTLYFYSMGYMDYFGFPLSFLKFDISEIIQTIAPLFFIILFIPVVVSTTIIMILLNRRQFKLGILLFIEYIKTSWILLFISFMIVAIGITGVLKNYSLSK